MSGDKTNQSSDTSSKVKSKLIENHYTNVSSAAGSSGRLFTLTGTAINFSSYGIQISNIIGIICYTYFKFDFNSGESGDRAYYKFLDAVPSSSNYDEIFTYSRSNYSGYQYSETHYIDSVISNFPNIVLCTNSQYLYITFSDAYYRAFILYYE